MSTTTLHGRWRLLVFAATWCEACTSELRTLAGIYPQLKDRVEVVPVMEHGDFAWSPPAILSRYAARYGLPFGMAIDPDGSAAAACAATGKDTPYSVLLDPLGAVRLVSSGFVPTAGRSSELADALRAFFLGQTPRSMPLLWWTRASPAWDAPLALESGELTSLARLSAGSTLVVTFLTGSGPLETARVRAIMPLVGAPGTRFLFAVQASSAVPRALSRDRRILIAHRGATTLFAAYMVTRGPVSFVLYRGRTVLGEVMAQPTGEAFEDRLDYAAFLSGRGRGSGIPHSGLPARLQRAGMAHDSKGEGPR